MPDNDADRHDDGNRREAREKEQSGDGVERSREPSILEWVVSALGAVIVLGVIGTLLYYALSGNDQSPAIHLRVTSIEQAGAAYRVEFVAHNTGDETARALEVEGALMLGDSTVESRSVNIHFVPGHAERRAGLFFARDPRDYRLQLSPVGFDRP